MHYGDNVEIVEQVGRVLFCPLALTVEAVLRQNLERQNRETVS